VQALPDARLDTASRILDAAERCMHRFGLRRVSMEDVAAEAGMSRGSIYNWFGDRQALVDAVLERTAERFVASSEAAVDRRRTLAGQVAEAAVFITGHLNDEAVTLRLPGAQDSLFATLLTAQATTLVERWVAFWLPRLAAAEVRGEVRPGLDHRRAAEWIVRLMLSFAVMPSATVDLSDADDVRTFVKDHLGGFT
jgi:AcrR family transcriptional regulator